MAIYIPRWVAVRQYVDSLNIFTDDRFRQDAVSARASARGAATALATRLLVKLGIQKPPVNIMHFATHFGITLMVGAKDEPQFNYDIALDVRDPATVRLWAHDKMHFQEQRSFYAHAMGHLFLHPFPDSKVLTCSWYENTEDIFEHEATAFARELLMPIWMVERERKDPFYFNEFQLAKQFDVHSSDMHRRLELFKN